MRARDDQYTAFTHLAQIATKLSIIGTQVTRAYISTEMGEVFRDCAVREIADLRAHLNDLELGMYPAALSAQPSEHLVAA